MPSGIAALLVAIVPLWMVLLEWLRPGGQTADRRACSPESASGSPDSRCSWGRTRCADGGSDAIGALVLVLASLSWAAGSLYTKFAPKASSGTMATGTQMLAGGLTLLVAAVVAGEPARLDLAHASTRFAPRRSCIC